MRPFTNFKKIDNDHVEKTDELTCEVKIINVDELANEFEQYLNNLHSDNYNEVIGNLEKSGKKLSILFVNYTLLIDTLINDYDEDIYFLDSGCIWQDFTITTEEGENITLLVDSPHDDILKYRDDIRRELNKELQEKKAKVDNFFFEITSIIDNGEKIDFSEMQKTLNEINTKVTKPKKPQWVQDAIDEGKLEKDGKTLRVKAEDMAHWLHTYGVEGVDTNFMMNNFRLRMKHSTAQQAATRGKPDFVKKHKK